MGIPYQEKSNVERTSALCVERTLFGKSLWFIEYQITYFVERKFVIHSFEYSVRPKPLFWFKSDTETGTKIGWYFLGRYHNHYRNHISKKKMY